MYLRKEVIQLQQREPGVYSKFVMGIYNSNELHHEKTCFMPCANNKDADQPAHPRSLISIFIVRSLDSIMPILATSKVSRL